jgi:ribonuclease HI
MDITILQWNANGLNVHGNEFKYYLSELAELPHVLCIQETHFNDKKMLKIPGYNNDPVFKNRSENTYGGVAIYVRKGLNYSKNTVPAGIECVSIKLFYNGTYYNISNFYQKGGDIAAISQTEYLFKTFDRHLLCGDFNSYSPLWGHSGQTRRREGLLLENFSDIYNYVCLNDGSTTFIGAHGKETALDLSFISSNLAPSSSWWVHDDTLSSNHFVVYTKILTEKSGQPAEASPVKKWNFAKADWHGFKLDINISVLKLGLDGNAIDNYNCFLQCLYDSAGRFIPSFKPPGDKQTKRNKFRLAPWWNDECKNSIKAKFNALNKYRSNKTLANFLRYKRLRGICKAVIKKARRLSWRSLCASFNKNTNLSKAWGVLKAMNGQSVRDRPSIPPLIDNGNTLISDVNKANLLGASFQKVSSSRNYSADFLDRKHAFEQSAECPSNPNFTPVDSSLAINEPFVLPELKKALSSTGNTSPGADGITYKILRQLDDYSLTRLLDIYNCIWQSGQLPGDWKHSIVSPVLKKGKDAHLASSYRPISLTSCLCKLMEKLVTSRLIWFLEHHKLLNFQQSGFRQGRSTSDHLARIYSDANYSLHNNNLTKAIFVDINKAFDMVWHDGLLSKIYNLGINGHMFTFIKTFLSNRTFQVNINGSLSESFCLENGTPQGSVISPILFALMINDIPFNHKVQYSLFADDLAIWASGSNERYINIWLKQNLQILSTWCKDWGFQISPTKTQGIVFTRRRKLLPERLFIGKDPIDFTNNIKYLGVIFDKRLTFTEHIKNVVDRCNKRFNLLKCLAGTSWGTGKKSLLIVYRGLIRSILEYASFIYTNVSKSAFHKLELIQNKCMRLICGAYQSTPVAALHVELGELPLHLRFQFLNTLYAIKCVSAEAHPAKSHFLSCPDTKYNTKHLSSVYTEFQNCFSTPVMGFSIPPQPPWHYSKINVNTDLQDNVNKANPAYVNYSFASDYISKWSQYLAIYTDGSKKDDIVSCSYYVSSFDIKHKCRLNDKLHVFTAEMFAIYKALLWVADVKPERVVIFSDSLSTLTALQHYHCDSRPYLLLDIISLVKHIFNLQIDLWFAWIPAHVGLRGNEIADALAKEGLKHEASDVTLSLSPSELRPVICSYICNMWQLLWYTSEKVLSIKILCLRSH